MYLGAPKIGKKTKRLTYPNHVVISNEERNLIHHACSQLINRIRFLSSFEMTEWVDCGNNKKGLCLTEPFYKITTENYIVTFLPELN